MWEAEPETPQKPLQQSWSRCPEDATKPYIMLEEDGTGGGRFRYLYSKFLKEAGEHLGIKEVAGLGERYQHVREKWTKVAHLIRDIRQTQQTPSKLKGFL